MESSRKFKAKKLKTKFSWRDLEKVGELKSDPSEEKGKGEKAGRGKQRNFGDSEGKHVWKKRLPISRKKALKEYFK